MDKPWKLVLLLVGIFAAGAVTGAFLSVKLRHEYRPPGPRPEEWGPNKIKKLSERLELSAEQREKLRPIIARDVEDLGRIRTTSIAESRRILERMERDINSALTEEQRRKFAEMNAESREKAKRFWEDRKKNEDRPEKRRDLPPPPPPEEEPKP